MGLGLEMGMGFEKERVKRPTPNVSLPGFYGT